MVPRRFIQIEDHPFFRLRRRRYSVWGRNLYLLPGQVLFEIHRCHPAEVAEMLLDPYSGIIHEACKPTSTEPWVKGVALAEAVKSSKIAVIAWINKGNQIRVYYQDPHLYLREYCYDKARWTQG